MKSILTTLLFITPLFAFTAKVVDEKGTPLTGATVTLENLDTTLGLSDSGTIQFEPAITPLSRITTPTTNALSYGGDRLTLSLAEPLPVSIQLFSLSGRQVFSYSQKLPAGVHSVATPVLAEGLYLLKGTVGTKTITQKIIPGVQQNTLLSVIQTVGSRSSRADDPVDMATFSAAGYLPTTVPVPSYSADLGTIPLPPVPTISGVDISLNEVTGTINLTYDESSVPAGGDVEIVWKKGNDILEYTGTSIPIAPFSINSSVTVVVTPTSPDPSFVGTSVMVNRSIRTQNEEILFDREGLNILHTIIYNENYYVMGGESRFIFHKTPEYISDTTRYGTIVVFDKNGDSLGQTFVGNGLEHARNAVYSMELTDQGLLYGGQTTESSNGYQRGVFNGGSIPDFPVTTNGTNIFGGNLFYVPTLDSIKETIIDINTLQTVEETVTWDVSGSIADMYDVDSGVIAVGYIDFTPYIAFRSHDRQTYWKKDLIKTVGIPVELNGSEGKSLLPQSDGFLFICNQQVIKTTPDFTIQWKTGTLPFYSNMTLPVDNGYMVVGRSFDSVGVIAKISNSGELLWSNHVTDVGDSTVTLLDIVAADNGFIAVGTAVSTTSRRSNIMIVKFDTSGELLWKHYYGTDVSDLGAEITKEGPYYLVGATKGGKLCGFRITEDGNEIGFGTILQ